MKRIKYACLEQTIHFELNDGLSQSEAAVIVKKDVESYKTALKRKRIPFQVVDENTLPDGSVMLKIKKQYNSYNCGDYLQPAR